MPDGLALPIPALSFPLSLTFLNKSYSLLAVVSRKEDETGIGGVPSTSWMPAHTKQARTHADKLVSIPMPIQTHANILKHIKKRGFGGKAR
jgi:hypothetical protein